MKNKKILRGGVQFPHRTLAANVTLATHNQTTVK